MNKALALLETQEFIKAKNLLEEILVDNPRNIDALYNLGMCFTEMGEPEKAIKVLSKCIEYKPDYSNAYVAMGYALTKTQDEKGAEKMFLRALDIDADNSYAMRNLGGLSANNKDFQKAIIYFEKALEINPDETVSAYGLGLAYKELNAYESADKYFRKVVDNRYAPINIKELAKQSLTEIAVKHVKSKGFRPDAMFYLLSALNLFRKMPLTEIREIAFEIGHKGQNGLDINDSSRKYKLSSLPGEFTGLQLVCYMYAGFKIIEPAMLDLGIDLSDEYQTALKMQESQDLA